MEEKIEAVASTQKKLLASHDPGWNDPPSWALSSPQSGTPTKRILNKRIAFPLNSKLEPSGSQLNQNLPHIGNIPPPSDFGRLTTAPHKPIITPTSINDSNSEIHINKNEALKDVLNNFQCLLEQLDSSKREEIQKRLDKMKIMWTEDKLNDTVHMKLLQISQALKENNLEKVDQLHISLMMDNASVCSSWIPGIRQLITEIKNKRA